VIQRLLSVFHARNLEFIRDRSTMIFVLVLPVAMIIGMSFVFGGKERPLFKVGVLAPVFQKVTHPFLDERFVEFVTVVADRQDTDREIVARGGSLERRGHFRVHEHERAVHEPIVDVRGHALDGRLEAASRRVVVHCDVHGVTESDGACAGPPGSGGNALTASRCASTTVGCACSSSR